MRVFFESNGIGLSQYGKGAHVDAFVLQQETLKHKVEESIMSREEIYLVEEYGSSACTDPDLHENMMKRKATKEWTSNHSEQFRTRSTDADTGTGTGTDTGTDTDYAIEERNRQYLMITRKGKEEF